MGFMCLLLILAVLLAFRVLVTRFSCFMAFRVLVTHFSYYKRLLVYLLVILLLYGFSWYLLFISADFSATDIITMGGSVCLISTKETNRKRPKVDLYLKNSLEQKFTLTFQVPIMRNWCKIRTRTIEKLIR